MENEKQDEFSYTTASGDTLRFAWCDAKEAHWWLMLQSVQFYGIKSLDGEGCLAVIEKYLKQQGITRFRLAWKLPNATPKSFKAWCNKWGKKVEQGYSDQSVTSPGWLRGGGEK